MRCRGRRSHASMRRRACRNPDARGGGDATHITSLRVIPVQDVIVVVVMVKIMRPRPRTATRYCARGIMT